MALSAAIGSVGGCPASHPRLPWIGYLFCYFTIVVIILFFFMISPLFSFFFLSLSFIFILSNICWFSVYFYRFSFFFFFFPFSLDLLPPSITFRRVVLICCLASQPSWTRVIWHSRCPSPHSLHIMACNTETRELSVHVKDTAAYAVWDGLCYQEVVDLLSNFSPAFLDSILFE